MAKMWFKGYAEKGKDLMPKEQNAKRTHHVLGLILRFDCHVAVQLLFNVVNFGLESFTITVENREE